MAIAADNISDMQKGIDAIRQWPADNELKMNLKKGPNGIQERRTPAERGLRCVWRTYADSEKTSHVPGDHYSSIRDDILSVCKERLAAAIRSISDIRLIHRMSLETAMKPFRTKVLPTLTYELEEIWDHLSRRQLQELESLKPRYLKSELGVSKFALSRYVYVLARETFLNEDLRTQMLLQHTAAYEELLRELQGKRDSLEESFLITDAMVNREWTQEKYELRHIITRFAINSFRHRICARKTFHLANQECICVLCSEQCGTYHVIDCKRRTVSLTQFCFE